MRRFDSAMPPVWERAHDPHSLLSNDRAADEPLRQLQLHQLELDQQNATLRDAQVELATERYMALFDLALMVVMAGMAAR